ncbi:MAG: DUF4286 family protein [Herpetosiphonaceae bacterium]|nr:DUF4286 family protein [Herpetosiphonaceae bacterium]
MVRYEVTVETAPELGAAFEDYMRQKHIPEIFATGCFISIHFDRADATHFRTSYLAATQADFERYLSDHAQHFRGDFAAHFPAGASAARNVWTEIERWG